MAGMIDKAPAAAPSGEGKLTPEALEAQMHLNPQQRKMLDRIVVSGLKVMFSAQSHKLMLKQLQGPQPMAQKIGEGIAGLMSLLFQESNRSIPPSLLVPAGTILCAHAAQWLRKVGQQVTDQDIGNAIEIMTTTILQAVGVNSDKLAAHAAGGQQPAPSPDAVEAQDAAVAPGAQGVPA